MLKPVQQDKITFFGLREGWSEKPTGKWSESGTWRGLV